MTDAGLAYFSHFGGQEQRLPSFNLIDPLKTFGPEQPDYACFGQAFDEEGGSADRTPTPAASLGRRLLALKNALDHVERYARRLTRWYAARDLALKQMQPHRMSPLRPGPPPFSRRRKPSDLEMVLSECHSLALYTRERHDSS